MEFLFCFVVIALFAFTIGFSIYVNCREEKNKKREKVIDGIFDKLNQKAKPLEKHKVIQELFIDCAKHISSVVNNLNTVETAIYTAELALHILAVFIANRYVAVRTLNLQNNYLDGVEINAFAICVKQFLNTLIVTGLKQTPINIDTVKQIMLTRTAFILEEKDFEVRNFNFQNVCNLEIQYEDENVFYIGKAQDMRIVFGNPTDTIILSSAYKIGLVDKYLQKFKSVI